MNTKLIKICVVATYLSMVAVNFLANYLPINNRSTGEISDAYPNLFAPAGYTFSIWGLIYLLLGAYTVYQFLRIGRQRKELIAKINVFFIGTSLANIIWILAWHYDYIWLSVLIMAVLLLFLIKIADALRNQKLSLSEQFFIRAPFSVYFGWITVATIANITVFLVSVNWNGFGITDYVWTSIILFVGAIIGIVRANKDKSAVYILVLAWAYLGVLAKHLSPDGFDTKYPVVIASVAACLVLFLLFSVRVFNKNKK